MKKTEYWPLILFCLLVTIGNLVSNRILLIASSILLLLQMVLNKNDVENFYLSLFLIPCIRIFDKIGFTFFVNFLLAIPLLIYLIKHNAINVLAIQSTAILLGFEVLHIVILGYIEYLPSTISCFLIMFYCLTITIEQASVFSLKKIWLFLCLGIFFSTVSYFVCNTQELSSIIYRVLNDHRFVAYADDPNYFSLYICLAISLFFVFDKHKIYTYLFLVFLISIGFLTASKMCIILMAIVLTTGTFYGLFNTKGKQRRRFSLTLICFMVLVFFIFKQQIIIFFNNFLRRLGDINDLNTITTGRFSLLKNYLSIYFTNPLTFIFGSGNQYHLFLGEVSGRGAHNTYFDVILSWGIIGLFAFALIVYKWNKKLPKVNSGNLIVWLPLFTLLVNFLDLSCLSATMFWLILSVPIITLRIKKQEKVINITNSTKGTNLLRKETRYGIGN